jgi:hypothetical protein
MDQEMSCCVHQAALSKLESLKIDADYNWAEGGCVFGLLANPERPDVPFRTYPGCTD